MKLVRAYKVVFAIYLGICLAVFPAYVLFYDLTEADVFRSVHLENHTLGDHLANLGKKWEGFGVGYHFPILLENSAFHLYPVFFRALSSSKDYFPLRC